MFSYLETIFSYWNKLLIGIFSSEKILFNLIRIDLKFETDPIFLNFDHVNNISMKMMCLHIRKKNKIESILITSNTSQFESIKFTHSQTKVKIKCRSKFF